MFHEAYGRVTAVLAVTAVLLGACPVGADPGEVVRDCDYTLSIDSTDAGRMRVKTTFSKISGDAPVSIAASSDLRIKHFWGDWVFSSDSRQVYDRDGILSFDHLISEDGSRYRIRGERRKNGLWCNVRTAGSPAEKDARAATDIAASLASATIPYAGLAVSLAGAVSGRGTEVGDLVISLSDFDLTVDEMPAVAFFREKGAGSKRSFRVLDTIELSVKGYTLVLDGRETIDVAGRTFDCVRLAARAVDAEIIYWITRQAFRPLLVKEAGIEQGVAYILLLETYRVVPAGQP